MAGNKEGGLKAADTNKTREPNFYRRIGAMGGLKAKGGSFRTNKQLAREAGRKGGMASRRRKHER